MDNCKDLREQFSEDINIFVREYFMVYDWLFENMK